MKITLNENQFAFIRRHQMIEDIINSAFELYGEEMCEFNFKDFITEIVWQVSDHDKELGLDLTDGIHKIDELHKYVVEHFMDYIEKTDKKCYEKNY